MKDRERHHTGKARHCSNRSSDFSAKVQLHRAESERAHLIESSNNPKWSTISMTVIID